MQNLELIEKLRIKLGLLAIEKGLPNPDVLELSERIDNILNEYYKPLQEIEKKDKKVFKTEVKYLDEVGNRVDKKNSYWVTIKEFNNAGNVVDIQVFNNSRKNAEFRK